MNTKYAFYREQVSFQLNVRSCKQVELATAFSAKLNPIFLHLIRS